MDPLVSLPLRASTPTPTRARLPASPRGSNSQAGTPRRRSVCYVPLPSNKNTPQEVFEHSRSRVEKYVTGEISIEALSPLDKRCDLTNFTKIGHGSLGDVLLAHHRRLGRRVAVKVVSIERLRSSGHSEASLRREIIAMIATSHPNIVRLLDVNFCARPLVGASAPPPYACLVMEHVGNSQSLSVLIRTRGPQSQLARQVIPQIAGAMQEMHSRGYVHRDLWSENVLVDTNGKVVIIDLGCAAQFTSGPAVENRMNVPYMSPQASARERQQPGDDCWTFGCLIAEVVTGRLIADHLGRCDVPLHSSEQTLQHLIHECYSLGGSDLGNLVAGLMERRTDARLTMEVVVTGMQASNGRFRTEHRGPPRDLTPQLRSGGEWSPNVPVAQKVTPRKSQGPWSCTPRGDSAKCSAVSADSKKSSRCSSASTAASMKDVAPSEDRGNSLMLAGGVHKSDIGGHQLSTHPHQALCDNRQHPLNCERPSAGHVALKLGARVTYSARSHRAKYSATVVTCERGAWRIRLECGGDRVVEEHELWRLKPVGA